MKLTKEEIAYVYGDSKRPLPESISTTEVYSSDSNKLDIYKHAVSVDKRNADISILSGVNMDSLPSIAARRKILLNDIKNMQRAIDRGATNSIKSIDHGTISFRGTYALLRNIGFNPIKAFFVAGSRKVVNVIDVKRF